MSKQIYIDSDGNEIQVSGTVNSADMMPMSASDSTKVSEAIMRSNPVDQTAGKTKTLYLPIIWGAYYTDQWEAFVQFPFVCKNNNYSISLTSVRAENVGDITSKVSVTNKENAFMTIRTTRTMATFPDMYSSCRGRVEFTITFA